MTDFVHLHVHSEYSLLDGSGRVEDLAAAASSMGYTALALTDHGNMYGAIAFYKACKKHGIKPIFGCEVYTVIGDRREKNPKEKRNHLVLLAETQEGFRNLMKIVSAGYVDGFYYKPRVDREILKKYHKGIIAASACLGGEIPRLLRQGDREGAAQSALDHQKIFGKDNFFLELQNHGIQEQWQINEELRLLSKKTGIPLIVSNDVHYTYPEDAKLHDTLLCIQTGATLNEEERMKFPGEEFYLKSKEDMARLFPGEEDILYNTVKIAMRCNAEPDFDHLHLPRFEIPEGYTNTGFLRTLGEEGLKKRYPEITREIRDRFEFEMETIVEMGYTDYFLIVRDFIAFAKTHGIPVGPGRGSAAGSIVSYALEITDVDPIAFDLLFERFLNPERVSMPDIDIDFDYERREEVIEYVNEKYGRDHVAQIVTFGTLKARAAIRDVGRVMDIPLWKVDKVAKMVPAVLDITLEKALEMNPELKGEGERDPVVKELLRRSIKLEGLHRHASTHAAGVVITKDPVTDYVPLTRNREVLATQFTMTELEELGLLKMDFLGLRTLTVIRDAVNMVEENHGVKILFDTMTYDDPKVLDLFARGDTLGVFQFESPGMRNFLRELVPGRFEDLVAANSLFRPGPMDQIPKFCEARHDPEKISYIHPRLEDILQSTYGCIVYQEQVMEIVRKIGGYSLGQADLVRRAMSKKKMDVMERERKRFIFGETDGDGNILIPGALRNGVDEKSADGIFDLMIDFAKYAFNKSHSVAYAVVAYRTAYLKVYYPAEFSAALISSYMGDTDKVAATIRDCRERGITVLPPSVNVSHHKFTVKDGKIRFGLKAIRHVGTGLIEGLIRVRKKGEFQSLSDFIRRLTEEENLLFNKRAMESLIKAGALDEFPGNRAQKIAVFENLMDSFAQEAKRNLSGQVSLFALPGEEDRSAKEEFPQIHEFPSERILDMEKEVLGIYFSGHPLDPYREDVKRQGTLTTAQVREWSSEGVVNDVYGSLGGLLVGIRPLVTKNKEPMAFGQCEDFEGSMECIFFPRTYGKYLPLLKEGRALLLSGRVQMNGEGEGKLLVENVRPLGKNTSRKLFVKIPSREDQQAIGEIRRIAEEYPGDLPVILYDEREGRAYGCSPPLGIDENHPEPAIKALQEKFGEDQVKVKERTGRS